MQTPIGSAPEPADTESIETLIAAARHHLTKSEAILCCLCVALDHAETLRPPGIRYSYTVDAARELIVQAIEQLDLITLPALL